MMNIITHLLKVIICTSSRQQNTFSKMTPPEEKFFQKIDSKITLFVIKFLQMLSKFSKKAPRAPNFVFFAPNILPLPQPRFDGGDKVRVMRLLGPPNWAALGEGCKDFQGEVPENDYEHTILKILCFSRKCDNKSILKCEKFGYTRVKHFLILFRKKLLIKL